MADEVTSLFANTVVCGITASMVAGLEVSGSVSQVLHGSIYLLGVALGSPVMASLSERYGRLPIYHTSNVGLIIGLLACSRCTSSLWVLCFQAASGFFGSCPLVLGGPTIRDIVYAEEQCHNKILWSICRLCPLIGYVAGQYGTAIGNSLQGSTSWQDVFRYLGAAVSRCACVV